MKERFLLICQFWKLPHYAKWRNRNNVFRIALDIIGGFRWVIFGGYSTAAEFRNFIEKIKS